MFGEGPLYSVQMGDILKIGNVNGTVKNLYKILAPALLRCSTEQKPRVLITFSVFDEKSAHANVLLVNLARGELQWFDPNGDESVYPWVVPILEKIAERFGFAFMNMNKRIGPQVFQGWWSEDHGRGPSKYDDYSGFCITWSTMAFEYLVTTPDSSVADFTEFVSHLSPRGLEGLVHNYVLKLKAFYELNLPEITKLLKSNPTATAEEIAAVSTKSTLGWQVYKAMQRDAAPGEQRKVERDIHLLLD